MSGDTVPGRDDWTGELTIDPDVDPAKVLALAGALVDATTKWREANTCDDASVLLEALLCNVADILQGAPTELDRAKLANHCIAFVMRNCGADPKVVWAAHLASRGLEAAKPAGSA